jgi:hypothetical protein
MGGDHVVGLQEGLLGRLPVGGQFLLDVRHDVAVGEAPWPLEVIGQDAELVGERRRVAIEVDEDEARRNGRRRPSEATGQPSIQRSMFWWK